MAYVENKNHIHDFDRETQEALEGVYVLNYENLDHTSSAENMGFDKLKFLFNEPKRSIEAQIMYPPFPWEENE